jgi:hypothetical protein
VGLNTQILGQILEVDAPPKSRGGLGSERIARPQGGEHAGRRASRPRSSAHRLDQQGGGVGERLLPTVPFSRVARARCTPQPAVESRATAFPDRVVVITRRESVHGLAPDLHVMMPGTDVLTGALVRSALDVRPPSATRIRSAWRIVDSRWAI